MSSHRFITRSVTTGLAAAASRRRRLCRGAAPGADTPIIAPGAAGHRLPRAGRADPDPRAGHPRQPPAQSADNGSDFDWGDAGIGAGVAGLVLIAFGSRRTRAQGPHGRRAADDGSRTSDPSAPASAGPAALRQSCCRSR